MANKEKITFLSKYQMRVLYYKCKEGLTHEEIAEKLGRDVNTVQYHMTKIYKILEISAPGKSKEEMDAELKNEIGPIIRQMFKTFDDVRIWAPSSKKTPNEEKEEPEEEIEEPENKEEPKPSYQPPPSVEKILKQTQIQPAPPEIIEPPPPGIPRINWRRIIGGILLGLIIFSGWIIYPYIAAFLQGPTITAPLPIPSQTPRPSTLTHVPISTPTIIATSTPKPTTSPAATPTPTEIITRISSKDGMLLVYVPAGDFKMGSAKNEDPQARNEELPQHIVYLDAYFIDQTEVTNAQYAMCVADGGACTRPKDSKSSTRSSYYGNSQFANYPVVLVSWSQAAAYCAWAGRRLPSEAEWEKAARGPDGRIYPWGNTFDGSLANYCDINCKNPWADKRFNDGYVDTSPVGNYPGGVSVYHVFDMAGNAYEWVADWFGPYNQTSQPNPTGPASGVQRIIRGGSWGDDSGAVRAAIRSHENVIDNIWTDYIGFRCALTRIDR